MCAATVKICEATFERIFYVEDCATASEHILCVCVCLCVYVCVCVSVCLCVAASENISCFLRNVRLLLKGNVQPLLKENV